MSCCIEKAWNCKTDNFKLDEGNNANKKRRRLKNSPYGDVDKACYTWLINDRNSKVPVSGMK